MKAKLVTVVVIVVVLLFLSTLLVESPCIPQNQKLRKKAENLVKISEKALSYLEELVNNTGLDLSTEIEELRAKIEEARKLIEKGEWEKAIDICTEVLGTIEKLQEKVLSEVDEEYIEEFEEEVEKEIAKGRQTTQRRLVKALEVLAEKSNATFVIPLIEEIKDAIESGEPGIGLRIANVSIKLREHARAKLPEKLRLVIEEIVNKSKADLDEEDVEKAGQGILNAIERISLNIERLRNVTEHLKSVNASEKAIIAINKTIEHMKWVISHLNCVYKMIQELNKPFMIRNLIRELKRGLILDLPFEIIRIDYPKHVKPGEEIEITIELKNELDIDLDITISIQNSEGNILTEETKSISAGALAIFKFDLIAPGEQTRLWLTMVITYNNTVVLRIPLKIEVRGREVSGAVIGLRKLVCYPRSVMVGETVYLSLIVVNEGGIDTDITVNVIDINRDVVIFTTTVTIAAGGHKDISTKLKAPEEEGTWTIKVQILCNSKIEVEKMIDIKVRSKGGGPPERRGLP